MTEFQVRGFERVSSRTIELSSISRNTARNTIDIRANDGASVSLPASFASTRPELAGLKSGASLDQSAWFRLQRDARIAQSKLAMEKGHEHTASRGGSR